MEDNNDLVTKDFEAHPDVAADLINALMYGGEPIVSEKALVSAPTESIYQGKERLRNQYEDLGKYEMEDGRINMQYLFANQTRVDGGMLLRKAGYVGAAYREQYDEKASGFYPVTELVLYWGKKKWKRNRTLQQMFKGRKIPKRAWNYIDNLKLHVWEMRRLPPKVRRRFTSDMRIIADYLAEGDSYCSDRKIVHKESLLKMLRVLSGDRNVDDTAQILKEMNVREEDEITVCELFEQYRRQGISQGLTQGIAALIVTCGELGASFDETAAKVKDKFHLKDAEVQKNMAQYWQH